MDNFEPKSNVHRLAVQLFQVLLREKEERKKKKRVMQHDGVEDDVLFDIDEHDPELGLLRQRCAPHVNR